jgi:hypothetical protein
VLAHVHSKAFVSNVRTEWSDVTHHDQNQPSADCTQRLIMMVLSAFFARTRPP